MGIYVDIFLFCFLRTPVLCRNPNMSAGNMEPSKSFKLLLQTKLRRPYPRMEIVPPLYEQVVEFVAEEEELDWHILCKSGLMASVVEMVVT